MAPDPTEPGFAARARHEAQRYGADRLVFVRELVQNARDAGARGVEIEVSAGPRATRIVCRDDGEGMTFEHARLFLFTLYASSKSRRPGAAGRFGVGFWSVLRFVPSSMEVRSWPRHGSGWAVQLDGSLKSARPLPTRPRPSSGTEIVLKADRHEPELLARLDRALRHYCREVRQRDAPGRLLLITLNGRGAHGTLDLPAPRTRFRRGALRGVVGLAEQPQALVYSQGLLVREASFLDDLLAPDDTRPRPAVPDLDEGLAPRALLDHRALQPLLSRNDVHDSRPLRRAVRLAQLEMGRLVDRQLGQAAPPSFGSRARDILARVSPGAALVAGAVAALALASAWVGLDRWPTARTPPPLRHPGPSLYRDLRRLYAGPDTGPLAESLAPVELTYRPTTAAPLLRALAIDNLDEPGASNRPLRPAPLSEPVGGGLEVSLLAVHEPGELRLPVPTGHQVDARSVHLDGQPVPLFLSSLGEPSLRLPRSHRGRLQYRTQPAHEGLASPLAVPQDPPEELTREAARLRGWPIADRVAAATEWTRNRVARSQEATVARQHAVARRRGERFLTRALAIAAGDCDVQNGVLVELLRQSGVPARLAVGYVGRDGRALPWLHAWAEYQLDDGRWRSADASLLLEGDPGRAPVSAPDRPAPADHLADSGTARPRVAVPPRVPSRDTRTAPGLGTAAAALLGAVPLLLLLALRRTRRSMVLDPSPDVSRLLQGALRHPDAFREAPAVFHRPLVPLCAGGRASLLQAWTEASQDRLYCARHPGTLTRAVARHALVVDATRPEGAAVAAGLGAVDLDHWQRLLDRSHASPPLDDIVRRLSDHGPRIRARILPSLSAPISLVLPTGPGRHGGEHLLLVPEEPPWNGAAGPGPWLDIAEAILDRLDVPGPRRSARLATLSRRLVLEVFPR